MTTSNPPNTPVSDNRQTILATTVEAHSKPANPGFDRRLAAFAKGTSPYTNNIQVREVFSPPGFRLFAQRSAHKVNYEAVFTVTGVVLQKCLPPFIMNSEKAINRPHRLRQSITITGVGSATFEDAVLGLDEVYRACERSFPEGMLVANDYSSPSGNVIQAANRYFTPTEHAGAMVHIPFSAHEDPSRVLEGIASSGELSRTIDNQVTYGIMRSTVTGESIFYPISPQALRNHDVVDLSISFSIQPVKKGFFRLLPILRSVTILEEAHLKLRIPRVPIRDRCRTARECGRRKFDFTRYRAPEVAELRGGEPQPTYSDGSTIFGVPLTSSQKAIAQWTTGGNIIIDDDASSHQTGHKFVDQTSGSSGPESVQQPSHDSYNAPSYNDTWNYPPTASSSCPPSSLVNPSSSSANPPSSLANPPSSSVNPPTLSTGLSPSPVATSSIPPYQHAIPYTQDTSMTGPHEWSNQPMSEGICYPIDYLISSSVPTTPMASLSIDDPPVYGQLNTETSHVVHN